MGPLDLLAFHTRFKPARSQLHFAVPKLRSFEQKTTREKRHFIILRVISSWKLNTVSNVELNVFSKI